MQIAKFHASLKFFLLVGFQMGLLCSVFAQTPDCKEGPPDLIPYREGDKWGYMSSEGNIVVNPKYSSASLFTNGWASVRMGDQRLSLSKDGKEEPEWRGFIHEPNEIPKELIFDSKTGKYGLKTESGKVLIDFIYEAFGQEGYGDGYPETQYFSYKLNGKWGIVTDNNKTVLPFLYDDATALYSEKSVGKVNVIFYVEMKGKGGFIDCSGKKYFDN